MRLLAMIAVMMAGLSATPAWAVEPEEVSEQVVLALAAREVTEARRLVREAWPNPNDNTPNQIVQSYDTLTVRFGAARKPDLIREDRLGDAVYLSTWLVAYENENVFVRVALVKGFAGWQINDMAWSVRIADMMPGWPKK